MRLTIATELNRPRADVFRAYTDLANLKAWQQNLVEVEPVSGTPGQPGAELRLTYRERGKLVTLTATVVERNEPESYSVLSVGQHMTLAANNRFIAVREQRPLCIPVPRFRALNRAAASRIC